MTGLASFNFNRKKCSFNCACFQRRKNFNYLHSVKQTYNRVKFSFKIFQTSYLSPNDSTTPDSKKLSPATKLNTKNEAMACSKRGTALRQRSVRMNSNVKSRAIVSTDSSTSDDGSPDKEVTPKIESPSEDTTLHTSSEFKPNAVNPIKNETLQSFSVHGAINSSSSDEVDDDVDNQLVRK